MTEDRARWLQLLLLGSSLAADSMVWARVEAYPRERQIVKMSFESPLGGVASVSARRRALVALSWAPARVQVPIPNLGDGAAYHLRSATVDAARSRPCASRRRGVAAVAARLALAYVQHGPRSPRCSRATRSPPRRSSRTWRRRSPCCCSSLRCSATWWPGPPVSMRSAGHRSLACVCCCWPLGRCRRCRPSAWSRPAPIPTSRRSSVCGRAPPASPGSSRCSCSSADCCR